MPWLQVGWSTAAVAVAVAVAAAAAAAAAAGSNIFARGKSLETVPITVGSGPSGPPMLVGWCWSWVVLKG